MSSIYEQRLTERRDEIVAMLLYEPDTGRIVWKQPNSARIKAGSSAGCIVADGIGIRIFGVRIRAHRLAWFLFYGDWPVNIIDHIDGNPLNNSIANLRDVSFSVNQQNQRKAHTKNKTSGLLGVSRRANNNKWQAQISVCGVVKYLGSFSSAAEAHEVYLEAKRKFHDGCTI